jgi:uncharacterized protein YjgD (DUF1641 family)
MNNKEKLQSTLNSMQKEHDDLIDYLIENSKEYRRSQILEEEIRHIEEQIESLKECF